MPLTTLEINKSLCLQHKAELQKLCPDVFGCLDRPVPSVVFVILRRVNHENLEKSIKICPFGVKKT